ncbi:MAG: hypothetical protein PHF31_11895 [Methylobacter sp.]|jgi:hypothetical protein|nr:hypothetical protein [Methylobacter sp.]
MSWIQAAEKSLSTNPLLVVTGNWFQAAQTVLIVYPRVVNEDEGGDGSEDNGSGDSGGSGSTGWLPAAERELGVGKGTEINWTLVGGVAAALGGAVAIVTLMKSK